MPAMVTVPVQRFAGAGSSWFGPVNASTSMASLRPSSGSFGSGAPGSDSATTGPEPTSSLPVAVSVAVAVDPVAQPPASDASVKK